MIESSRTKRQGKAAGGKRRRGQSGSTDRTPARRWAQAAKSVRKSRGGAAILFLCEWRNGAIKERTLTGYCPPERGRTGFEHPERTGRVGRIQKGKDSVHLVQLLSAAGHRLRLGVLRHLAEGPATYRSLVRTTGVRSGPLYYHLNRLRLSGIVAVPERDLYELTPSGRRFMVVVGLLDEAVRDSRRSRPWK